MASRLVKQTPRNLHDVASAYDLSPEHPPQNIYSVSSMVRVNQEARLHEQNSRQASYRKILDGIQKMSIQKADDEEYALRAPYK